MCFSTTKNPPSPAEHTSSLAQTYFPPPHRLRAPSAHSKKPYPCNFPGCRKAYLTLSKLQLHHRYHPSSFICRYTPYTGAFVAVVDRTVHEIHHHGKNTGFFCYMCTYSTSVEKAMKKHVSRIHEGVDVKEAMLKIVHGVSSEGLNVGVVAGQAVQKSAPHACNLCKFKTQSD